MRRSRNKSTQNNIIFGADTVAKLLRHTHSRKSLGLDENCGKVLQTCAEQLSHIFNCIFMKSLELQKIPVIWKHLFVAPVTKCMTLKTLHDFRPVALTSLVMKILR